MKKVLLVLSLLFVITIVNAQSSMFEEGDRLVNVGIGINNHPTIVASVDQCIADGILDEGSIGVGPYAGLEFSSNEFKIGVGARGTFHYPIIDDLDTYLGFGVGLRYNQYTWRSNDITFIPGFFIGANYPVTEDITVFGEIGNGVSYLSLGITLRM